MSPESSVKMGLLAIPDVFVSRTQSGSFPKLIYLIFLWSSAAHMSKIQKDMFINFEIIANTDNKTKQNRQKHNILSKDCNQRGASFSLSFCVIVVEDYMEIKNQFSKNRSTLPLMYISTPEDKHTSYITKRHPSAPILNRVAVLALESLNVLQSQLEHTYLGVDFKVR